MNKMNVGVRDFLLVFASCVIASLGIAMIIKYDFGVDPLSLFQVGVSISSTLSIGTISLIYSVIIYLISFVINKHKVGLGTVVYTLSIGPLLDAFLKILPSVKSFEIVLYLIGHLMLCFGVAALIYLNKGFASLDVIIDFISSKFSVHYSTIKLITDVIFTVCGVFLGASIQMGTLYLACCSGYYIETFVGFLLRLNSNKSKG